MIRTCVWCRRTYDTKLGSSAFCESNPNRERNRKGAAYKRWYKQEPRQQVVIGALLVPKNPFHKTK